MNETFKLIENDERYKAILLRIYSLMQRDLKLNSAKFNELDTFSTLVKEYETIHYPVPKISGKPSFYNEYLLEEIKKRDEDFKQRSTKLTTREEHTARLNSRRNTL